MISQDHVEVATRVLKSWEVAASELEVEEEATVCRDGDVATPTRKSGRDVLAMGSAVYGAETREVAEHYVVKDKTSYMRTVIAEVKNRFGQPSRTAANVLAVRKFAGDAMRKHKVRPTHIARMLPLVVECVFMESAAEEDARRVVEAVHLMSGHKWWRTLKWLVGAGFVKPVPHQVA